MVVFCVATAVGFLCPPPQSTTTLRSRLFAAAPPPEEEEDEESKFEDMRELFMEAIEADGGKGAVPQKTASLYDLNDAQFLTLMRQRLGEEDFNRVFKDPRVDFDMR